MSSISIPSVLPQRTQDTPTKVYKGGCHCRKFEYECRHPVLESGFEVLSCNCSICTQRGYLLIYTADPNDFKLLKGSESELTNYQFYRRHTMHKFCPVCGTGIFESWEWEGKTIIGINARTIADLDLDNLTLRKVDGRAL